MRDGLGGPEHECAETTVARGNGSLHYGSISIEVAARVSAPNGCPAEASQSVEQWSEEPRVGSSILALGHIASFPANM